jgi:sugar lactone lactonase YvrE
MKRLTVATRMVAGIGALLWQAAALAANVDEFRVKREAVYEFVQKPEVRREGDQVAITFESKGLCDVTVAIEDAQGRIIRHLASGVLGAKAPAPFQSDSRKQTVVWDGKNDQDRYVDDKDACVVRVSLGLKPQFEKNLYWSPYKRISQAAPLLAANEEGVVVCEGSGVDSVRLYDHDGNYRRTVYPFPAAKLKEVRGLDWKDVPQGFRVPWKQSLYQQTLLTSGDNASWWDLGGRHGRAATGIGLCGNDLLLAGLKLNRLNTDGSSGGRELLGGVTSFSLTDMRIRDGRTGVQASPTSVAISPDRKWVYLAGYAYRMRHNFDTMHGVARIPMEGTNAAQVFTGKIETERGFAGGAGAGPGEFINATSVDCDAQGRVYVSDFMNDRIQIFSPDGKFLKQIKTEKPAIVKVNRKNGEIWVISWMVPSRHWSGAEPAIEISTSLARFAAFDNPRELSRQALPMGNVQVRANGKYSTYTGLSHPLWFTAEIDFWSAPATIWVGRECRNDAESGVHPGDGGRITPWETAGIRLLREKDGKWEFIRDFGAETVKQAVRARPPMNAIQQLEVNPLTGRLYVGEADSAPTGKASTQLLEIDVDKERIKVIELPFNPIEYVFDLDGSLYMRNTDTIVRYDARSFREIPFDYGEQRQSVGRDGGIGGRATAVNSGLILPSKSPVCYHQGGIDVNARGQIVASCAYRMGVTSRSHYALDKEALAAQGGAEYQPAIYPGRISSSTTPCIHVWDKHGNLIREDAVPGIGQVDGIKLDREGYLYFMLTAPRDLDGKPYFDRVSETIVKVRPRQVKIVTRDPNAPVPLRDEEVPKRNPDVYMGGAAPSWIEGAEWFYGGVGFAGFSPGHAPACACWFSRFALDYFARVIAPEPTLFSVAVLDSAGNLITRIGRYGNVDDGVPMRSAEHGTRSADGRPEGVGNAPDAALSVPRSLGGDEVGLFYACYVGTHTDRRIFISDVGNGRIVSVLLGYHAEEKVALKNFPDMTRKP